MVKSVCGYTIFYQTDNNVLLSNKQQCVAVNGTTSSEVQVRSGVPQGSVLGPFLFLIHISDINFEIVDSTVSCFADDTRILLEIKYEEDTQMLQNDLHKLYKQAYTNNMKFNANKVKLLRYGKEQEIKSATTYKSYDDSNIDDKEQVRDLGGMSVLSPCRLGKWDVCTLTMSPSHCSCRKQSVDCTVRT